MYTHINQAKLNQKLKYFQPNLSIDSAKPYLDSLNDIRKRVFMYFWYMTNASMRIDVDQGYLGRRFGVSRKTINEIYGEFKSMRIIHSTRRFNDSCIIYLSRFFFLNPIKEILKVVASSIQTCLREKVTITNNKEEIITKIAIVYVEGYPYLMEYQSDGPGDSITLELLRLRASGRSANSWWGTPPTHARNKIFQQEKGNHGRA